MRNRQAKEKFVSKVVDVKYNVWIEIEAVGLNKNGTPIHYQQGGDIGILPRKHSELVELNEAVRTMLDLSGQVPEPEELAYLSDHKKRNQEILENLQEEFDSK